MRTAVSVSRLVLVLLTTLLIIAGIVISLVAVGTPAWQVVNITEFHTEHQHGLWLDCTIGRKHVQGSSDSSLHCTYKFENPTGENDPYNIQGTEEQHKFFKWHKAVLGFFVISVLTALVSLCFTLCSPSVRVCAIVANVLSLITVSLTVVAMVVYFINSHKVEVRFVHGITRTYEVGYTRGGRLLVVSAKPRILLLARHRRRVGQPRRVHFWRDLDHLDLLARPTRTQSAEDVVQAEYISIMAKP
uniref:Clc-like protein n=1 Tax=Steinernema glaseri TaxID=37863 RepID=A0A1I8APF3_9BILA